VTKRAKTLAAAVRAADKLGKTDSGKKPMIYAVTADKMTVHVPAAMIAKARKEADQKATADSKRGRAAVEALGRVNAAMAAEWPATFGKAATAARRAASKAKGARPQGRRAEITENAAKG